MIQDVRMKWLIAIVVLTLPAAAQAAITIDTVGVGNLGNTGDVQSEGTFGAVGYNYNIGKYEVTAGQYRDLLNAVDPTGANSRGLYNSEMNSSSYGCQITWNSAAANGSKYDFSGRPSGSASDWENRPVNYVSFWDAARFANWLHNGQGNGDTESGAYHDVGNQSLFGRVTGAEWFLPTENEWYKAAYHKNDGATGNYFDYPTSSDSTPSNDLNGGGNNATFYDTQDGSVTIGSPYYRTKIGEHANSASPYGTFDQGGNVWEWNETAISSSRRGQRGGAFYDGGTPTAQFLLSSYRNHNYEPTSHSSQVGFRVASSAAIPEPGSILVWLGLGVIGLIWSRRRSYTAPGQV